MHSYVYTVGYYETHQERGYRYLFIDTEIASSFTGKYRWYKVRATWGSQERHVIKTYCVSLIPVNVIFILNHKQIKQKSIELLISNWCKEKNISNMFLPYILITVGN